ncbi:Peroxide stress-activated histidine kinase mak2 [Leucoagaricus sp. SymC.cos]|nr:Peroxide stress-activated histidine kinase mak2 [Leucoagaricus sp. SymC.cos]
MPSWLRRFTGNSARWTDEENNLGPPLRISMGEKGQDFTKSSMPTPATSTAIDHILPPPAVQSNEPIRVKTRAVRRGVGVYWNRLKKQLGAGIAPSNSSLIGDSAADNLAKRAEVSVDEDGEVNQTVVDRVWFEEFKSSESPSEHGNNSPPQEKSNMGHTGQTGVGNTSDSDSVMNDGSRRLWKPFVVIRHNFYPTLREFFFTRFEDEKSESHYAQEDWILKKSLAIWAALWLIVNWVLGVALLDGVGKSKPIPGDIAFYFVVGPLLAFPVLKICHFYPPKNSGPDYPKAPCASRDFLGLFFYTTALQTMGLFGLKLNRLMAAIGAFSFFVMTSCLMIPASSSWVRNMINFFVFHFFLIYVHYMRENVKRRLYTLRYQLKVQYRATQKAQVNERKTADSKRRLTSPKTFEVTPVIVLAVQNMEATGNILKDQQIEFNALSGSLSMMSKVLNDVLDFNKMDSGKFESASRPYAFHQAMRSLLIPLGLATGARNLTLETYLDPNIDIIARKCAYEALGERDVEVIRRHIEANPTAPGVVTGDETRLRQVVTNLASNACKFTPAGGKLTIRTKLVFPHIPPDQDPLDQPQKPLDDRQDGKLRYPLSVSNLSQHDTEQEVEEEEKEKAHSHSRPGSSKLPAQQIVVRIEVEDTGYGIKPSDMHKLFTAFNQTEQGRQQGGKGTGLGLALVRQIVKLSGGRLGVQSKVGRGSTFWVELPLGVGHEAVANEQCTPEPTMPPVLAPNHVEYVAGQALMRTGTNGTVEGCSAPATPDGLGKGKEIGSGTRTNSAMHNLMDQAGRFELVLRKRNSENRVPTRTIGDPSTGTQYDSPPDLVQEGEDDVTVQDLSTAPASSTAVSTPRTRPTFVQLPSPRQFPVDTQLPHSPLVYTPAISSYSTSSTSPLAMFDAAHARGSPSSINAGMSFETAAGMSVLVVDDDSLTRTLMKRILTRLGCHVSTAENGEVALEMILGRRITIPVSTPSSDYSKREAKPILEQEVALQPTSASIPTGSPDEYKFAVVFLDNQMPVMSGLKVVAKLRELGRKDFVVGVTGNALLSDQQEYLEAGVDKVLTKPVLERSLRDALQCADERRKNISREANSSEGASGDRPSPP